uniref:Myeloid cell nuclear differentiation antigen n=1 Tax=Cricetulus griseus TaxID=10029 RepID=A0A8C2MAT9_CRIGR
MNKYKKIVLIKGFEVMDDYHFRTIKSLLRKELNLTKKMQDDYDRIQISDLMEDTFPKDAGLDKLIEVCQSIKELGDLVQKLKTEKAKGNKGTHWTLNSSPPSPNFLEKTGVKKTKRSEGPDHLPCPGEGTARCQSPGLLVSSSAPSNTSLAKVQVFCLSFISSVKILESDLHVLTMSLICHWHLINQKHTENPNQSTIRGAVLIKDPMIVMVLNATDPFEYESSEHGVKNMFHATVATVDQYFHVKVFNINLKDKFTKENVIIISNYFKLKGTLDINEVSSVMEAGPGQKIEVPNKVIRNANQTPKISDIHKYAAGALVYGLFTLHMKKVNPKNTVYEIKDDTGNIEVIGNGKWYNINCEEGDKLRLFCFQLKTIDKQPKLVCGEHSFIKVTKAGKKKKIPTGHLNPKDEEGSGYPQVQFSAFNSGDFKIETPSNWK